MWWHGGVKVASGHGVEQNDINNKDNLRFHSCLIVFLFREIVHAVDERESSTRRGQDTRLSKLVKSYST